MRLFIAAAIVSCIFFSCADTDTPDVSGIQIKLTTERFEKKLFDTVSNNLTDYLRQLQHDNPTFTSNYLKTILNVDPQWPIDSAASYVNGFITAYRPLYDSAEKIFYDFSPYEKEIRRAMQYVKYYFPPYKLPEKIITYIGPADGYGDVLTPAAFLVGLHHHLGKNFGLYKSEMVQQYYPEYISQRFEPSYISINCMKNIVDDMYPEKEDDKPLINQMIEKGKRLALLQKFLPGTAAYKLIGYTAEQLNDGYKHEAAIWDLFIKNNYLQVTDKNIIKNYVEESPKTQELGEGAPGNIGSFAGWQIVKKYMQKNPAVTLPQLMNTDAETIFQQVKYKP